MKYEYGNWLLVIVNITIFMFFIKLAFKPKTKTDWRTYQTFSAFLAALFAEMYGFPLTIYLFTSFFGSRFFTIDFSHDSGHLLNRILNMGGDPHFNWLHLMSNGLIIGGLILIASAWKVLHKAQKKNSLATTGAYHYVRHPQYTGFILIIIGFLLQWPTVITLFMAPILIFRYIKLAREEEKEMVKKYRNLYEDYRKEVAGFIPSFRPSIHQSKQTLLNKKIFQ